MRYGQNHESAVKEASVKIEGYRITADAFPVFRSVTEKFDGKVLNCRYEKALKAAFQGTENGIYVEKHGDTCSIRFHPGNTVSGNWHTLASVRLKDFPDGKRIPAKLLIDSARNFRAGHLRKAAEMEAAIGQVDDWKQQIEYLKHQIDVIVGGIPYEIKDIFNLYYTVRII